MNSIIKGALSWHFCYFPVRTLQKSFFLIFTRAGNIALKFWTNTSINFLQGEQSMVQFWLCLEDGYENFEQLGLNFSKLSLPPATIKSNKQSQWIRSYVVFSKQTSFLFLSFHWFEDTFQYSKVGQNGVTEPLYCSLTWSKYFLGNPQIKAKQFSFFL